MFNEVDFAVKENMAESYKYIKHNISKVVCFQRLQFFGCMSELHVFKGNMFLKVKMMLFNEVIHTVGKVNPYA